MAQDILAMEVTDEDAPARPESGDLSPLADTDGVLSEDGQRFDSVNPPSSKCSTLSRFLYRATTAKAVQTNPLTARPLAPVPTSHRSVQ